MEKRTRRVVESKKIKPELTGSLEAQPTAPPDHETSGGNAVESTIFTAPLIGEIIDQEVAEVDRIRIAELAAKGRLANLD